MDIPIFPLQADNLIVSDGMPRSHLANPPSHDHVVWQRPIHDLKLGHRCFTIETPLAGIRWQQSLSIAVCSSDQIL